MEEAKKGVHDIPGSGEPAPSARFIPGFGESSLDFTLTCKVADFTDQGLVQQRIEEKDIQAF